MKTIEELRNEFTGKCLNDFIVISIHELPEGIEYKQYINLEKDLLLPVAELQGTTKIYVMLEHKETKSKRLDPLEDVQSKIGDCVE